VFEKLKIESKKCSNLIFLNINLKCSKLLNDQNSAFDFSFIIIIIYCFCLLGNVFDLDLSLHHFLGILKNV